MRALVVYESMYGNTHAIAEAIAVGLRTQGEIRVVPVHRASADAMAWADLVIVGGPTHIHGMTRATSRKAAADAALKPASGLTLEPDAVGSGLREWLSSLGTANIKRAAAFDTRVDAPALLTGRASGGIARELSHHGFKLVARPESFLVDTRNQLVGGEVDRATRWGASLVVEPVPTSRRARPTTSTPITTTLPS